MQGHSRIIEQLKLAAAVAPAILNNVEKVTPWVDFSRFAKLVAILNLGDMAAETIDFRLESCPTQGVSGSPITTRVFSTQRAADATANDSKQMILEVDQSQVGGDQYVRARGITGGATGGYASMLVLGQPEYSSQPHITTVVEAKSA